MQLTRQAQPLPPPQPPFQPVSCFPLPLQTQQLRSRDFRTISQAPTPSWVRQPSGRWRKLGQNKPPERPNRKQVERAASSLTFGLNKVTCQVERGGASWAAQTGERMECRKETEPSPSFSPARGPMGEKGLHPWGNYLIQDPGQQEAGNPDALCQLWMCLVCHVHFTQNP